MAFDPNLPKIQAHLCVKGGLAATSFYEQAIAAHCTMKQMAGDGARVLHANVELFGGEIMLHDEFPEFGGDVLAPSTLGGASAAVSINLPAPADVDTAVSAAVAASVIRSAMSGRSTPRFEKPE